MNAQMVYQWSYSRERADFRLPVNELKGIDADVIFFAGLEPWAGDFLRSARGVGLTTPIIGAFSDTPEMRKRAGQALEGAMYFDMYNVAFPEPGKPGIRSQVPRPLWHESGHVGRAGLRRPAHPGEGRQIHGVAQPPRSVVCHSVHGRLGRRQWPLQVRQHRGTRRQAHIPQNVSAREACADSRRWSGIETCFLIAPLDMARCFS